MNCSRLDCRNEAVKNPVAAFRAKGASARSPQIKMMIDFPVCEEHAMTDPDYFITDEGWAFIVKNVKQLGYVEPERNSVEISFVDLQPHNPFEFLK